MNDNKQTPKTLDDILAEMRNAAKDSYAEKTAKRLEDHEATGTRDALDINDAIQCLRDDDKYLIDLADRLEAAVNRMRDAYCDLCKEKDEAYDRLLLERDKAVKASASGNVATPPCKGRWMNGRSYALRAMQSCANDADVAAVLSSKPCLRLANQFHRVKECGRINAPGKRGAK